MYKYKFLQVGQLPREHLSFLQNLLNYFITKYLKHEVDGNLSIWVDKCNSYGLYNWRYKDLSLSHDQKAMVFGIPNGEVPYQLLSQKGFYYQIWWQ